MHNINSRRPPSRRDYFAGLALQALIPTHYVGLDRPVEKVVAEALEIGEAMEKAVSADDHLTLSAEAAEEKSA